MSVDFLIFSCIGCRGIKADILIIELFRNRQKLFRHKKTCQQFGALPPESNVSAEDYFAGVKEEIGTPEVIDVNSAMKVFMKLNSLEYIISEELTGSTSSLTLLDLKPPDVVCKYSAPIGVGQVFVNSLEDAIADELHGLIAFLLRASL
jgi:hypothetical protein